MRDQASEQGAQPLRASRACSADASTEGLRLCLRIRLAPGRGRGAQMSSASGGGRTMLLRTLAALLALAIGGIAASSMASAKDRGRSQGPALDANWVLLETRAL